MNMLRGFYIHSYKIYTYSCFYLICICMPILYMFIHYMQGVGRGGEGGGEGVGWYRSKGQKAIYIYYMYFLLRVVYYTCIYIYTYLVLLLFRVACTYAQLFGNRRLAKSLIDMSIVPF